MGVAAMRDRQESVCCPVALSVAQTHGQPECTPGQPKTKRINKEKSPKEGGRQDGVVAQSVAQLSMGDVQHLTGWTKQNIHKLVHSGKLQAEKVLVTEGPRSGREDWRFTLDEVARIKPDAQRIHGAVEATKSVLSQPVAPAIAQPQDAGTIPSMKDWQRKRMDARLALLRHIEVLARDQKISRDRAVDRLIADADAKRLPEEIQQLVHMANARSGQSGTRTLSRRTIQRWAKDAKAGYDHLAPKAWERPMPSWLPQLLGIWRQPQKPSLSWAVQTLAALLPAGAKVPSYDAVRRALAKVGTVELEKGRMLPREIKNLKPFRRREKPDYPFDVIIADGHTFDAEIAHPDHGRPFRPEMTVVVDVCTSRVVGWSAWEKENTWAVQDALRQGVLMAGTPLIFYTDNGPGYKNDRLKALEGRLGIEHKFGIPYNSQARGVVERLQKTLWIELGAKTFGTYVGAQMDREARQIVFKASRKGEPVLPGWKTFVAFMELVVETYNARPSRACPKALNAETGRMQHLSPAGLWERHECLGWLPEAVPQSLDDFRPEEVRKVLRGEISLFGNRYFSQELKELHGDMVKVAFDIHDATRVWVYREDGTFVCEAGFEANSTAYFPKAYVETLREQRKDGQRKRLLAKQERVLGEPLEPVEIRELTAEALEASESQLRKLGVLGSAPQAAQEPAVEAPEVLEHLRPAFKDDREYALWVLDHPGLADAEEVQEIMIRLRNDQFYRIRLDRDANGQSGCA